MDGMTMMLSRLIGMKPEEMRAQFEGALNLMKNGASAAEKMQRDIDAIKTHLGIQDEVENVGTIANSRDSANGNRIQL